MSMYLIGFPIIGCGLGYVFVYLLSLLGNEVNIMSYKLSIVIWGGFGLFAGIIGARQLRSIHLLAKKYENSITKP